jgi:hypothetical protein
MHNLHLIVCNGDTGKEACDEAESYASGWGDENNWRTMCGAISEKDEIYDNEDGRFPIKDCDTIKSINKMVQEWISDNEYEERAMKFMNMLVGGAAARPSKLDDHQAWILKQYANHLYHVINLAKEMNGKPYNIFKYSFYAEVFDHCGVTDISDEKDKRKKWVVFMDMHS